MEIKNVSLHELRRMNSGEGLVLQGCGGDLKEWVDGINDMLTESGILKNQCKFEKVYTFENSGLTCLLFPFDEKIDVDIGKLAIWRIQTHAQFGGTWLTDYAENSLGGFVNENEEMKML